MADWLMAGDIPCRVRRCMPSALAGCGCCAEPGSRAPDIYQVGAVDHAGLLDLPMETRV